MLLLLQQSKTYASMNLAVWLRDPDLVLLSTLAGEVLFRPYKRKEENPRLPLIKLLNSNNLRDSSARVVLEDMGMDEVSTLVFPSLTSISPINDNYCVSPSSIQVSQVKLDQQISQNKVIARAHGLNKLLT